MPNDRNRYRDMPTNELREQIHYGVHVNWKELAIALAERLDTVRREAYAEASDNCPDCGGYY